MIFKRKKHDEEPVEDSIQNVEPEQADGSEEIEELSSEDSVVVEEVSSEDGLVSEEVTFEDDSTVEAEEVASDDVASDGKIADEIEFEEEQEAFPAPHQFEVIADDEPVTEEDREEIEGLPTGEEEAFEPEGEEFLGDAEVIVDDNQTDYYQYGDKMHGVRKDIIADSSAPKTGRHGRGAHSKPTRKEERQAREAALPEFVRKSRKTRVLLIVAAVALGILLALFITQIVYLAAIKDATAVQQQDATQVDAKRVNDETEGDETAHTTKSKATTVPMLTTLIGLTQDAAIAQIGHGATITLATPITNETGEQVGATITVMLTEEPTDSKSGTPTVFLTITNEGIVTQARYSAATASLGFGSLSFRDAILNEYVIEKTLNEAGLVLNNGTMTLPEAGAYSTYAADGKTVVTEKYSFDGTNTVNGITYAWSAVLMYDYAAANASGNLSDTVRQITISISQAA